MIQNYINQITQLTNLSKQEAIWLLEHICQENYTKLLNKTLTEKQEQLLTQYIDQINNEHKPLAYIIGWVPFLDLKIKVHPPILIPRPETEEWVHKLIEQLSPYQNQIKKILEIGTGSGAIALSLAKKFINAEILAIDISPNALLLAQENAKINEIKNIRFLESDLFEKLDDQKFDLIVSNPPYIPETFKQTLSRSVTKWEDATALFSGKTGLDLITKIFKKSSVHINHQPSLPFQLVLEIDITQHESIQILAQQNNFICTIQKDLFNNWRTAWCTKKSKKTVL